MCQGVQGTGSVAAESFRLTPGWTSLGTITVGLLAVIVASYWNFRTLKRVEERYQADQREAHAEKVRDAILDVVHETTRWAFAFRNYRDLVAREVAATKTQEQATAAEQRIRAEADKSAERHNDLRRALWSAQLTVDDVFVRDSLVEIIELLGIREPEKRISWSELLPEIDRRHENRVKVNEKVDMVLDYALEHLQKEVPASAEARRLWRRRGTGTQ